MTFGAGFGFPRARFPMGAAPTLNMDFAGTAALPPYVTFSRGTNATYVDSLGNIAYAPSNLLTYSEQFDNAAWVKAPGVLLDANVVAAPNGSVTADKLSVGTSTFPQIAQATTAVVSATNTGGMYFKAGGLDFIQLRVRDTVVSTSFFRAVINLQDGSVTLDTVGGSGVLSGVNVENVGDGWWRASISGVANTSGTSLQIVIILTKDANGVLATPSNSAATDGVYIWGAQLNLDGLQPYNSTTVKNLLGYTQDFDNAAWTKSNSFIQTNLLTYSEQFENAAWTKSNSFIQTNQIRNNTAQGAVTGNPGISPTNWSASSTGSGITREIIGVGTESGIAYIDIKYSGTPTASSSVQVAFEGAGTVAASSGQTWTGSTYVTLASGSLSGAACSLSLLETNGTSGVVENSKVISPVAGALSTSRDSYTATLSGGVATTNIQPRIRIGFVVGVPIDITLRIGLPQLVQGAVPGDVVRTYGTATPVMYPSPIGTVTADNLQALSADSFIREGAAVTVSTYTGSVWLRADTPIDLRIYLVDTAGGAGTASFVDCSVSDTWQRFSVTRTASAGTTNMAFQVGGGNTFTTGESVYIWGAQLVQGATPGDYQATTTAALAVQYRAPDGSLTADKLVENTAAGAHSVNTTTISGLVSGTPNTYSVYAKVAEVGRFLVIALGGAAFPSAQTVGFTLSGAGSYAILGGTSTASVVFINDGWYRCSVTALAQASGTGLVVNYLSTSGTSGGGLTYTGDGTSGIYIWGAQLSDSASLDPYSYNFTTAPTAAAYYGPRFDYDPVTLACKGLLIEEQRTNSIRNNTMQGAVVGAPGTAPTNWSVFSSSAGLTSSIVAIGTEDGINYIDCRLVGTTTGNLFGGIAPEGINTVAASPNSIWSNSFYVKLVAGSLSGVSAIKLVLTNYNSSSVALNQFLISNVTPTSTALITQRFTQTSLSTTFSDAATAFVRPFVQVEAPVNAVIDITLRIGLPQLEQGAFATSVIPTTTTAVTRAADVAVIQGANFSNWYNQSEGTLYANYSIPDIKQIQGVLSVSDGTNNNRMIIRGGNSSIQTVFLGVTLGSTEWVGTIAGAPINIGTNSCFAYAANNIAWVRNAGTVGADTAAVIPVVNQLKIGADGDGNFLLNGHIARIAYYSTRQPNPTLQAITT